MDSYLIIDIGTGNVRVALTDTGGRILNVERDDVHYFKDEKYEEGLYFKPDELWSQIEALIRKVLAKEKEAHIVAITASSQREGVVLIDGDGTSIIGFPNHDRRGRYLQDHLNDKNRIYQLAGRYPSSLFSALKMAAYRDKYPQEWARINCFLSISDWAQYRLTGSKSYEHSQASETLLYDVEKKQWSDELLSIFGFNNSVLPPLCYGGTPVGYVKDDVAGKLNLNGAIPVVCGGADTQLAIKSTQPDAGDIVIVSGTTTPVVRVSTEYILDDKQRSWTNSNLDEKQYILETNCGVTGLNYQRVKSIFYPNETYDQMEKEMEAIREPKCYANLGSLLADEKKLVTGGGFLFDVPVMTGLTRADFAWACLWDIACCIKENFDCLLDIKSSEKDFVWGCGGGFQSRTLRKFVSSLIRKKLYIRPGFEQASVTGAALICAETMGTGKMHNDRYEITRPEPNDQYDLWCKEWKKIRDQFNNID